MVGLELLWYWFHSDFIDWNPWNWGDCAVALSNKIFVIERLKLFVGKVPSDSKTKFSFYQLIFLDVKNSDAYH